MLHGDHDEQLSALHTDLIDAGLITPVDPRDIANWARHDLASMVEGCFAVTLDPRTMTDAAQAEWLARLRNAYRRPVACEDILGRRYWLTVEGRPVGTVQLPLERLGRIRLPVRSLYVLPDARRQSVASQMLDALYDAAHTQGLAGIHIETYWVWQKAVHFYLNRGLWVVSWKHTLGFARDRHLPAYRVEIDATAARIAVQQPAGWRELFAARRVGDRLVLDDSPWVAELERTHEHWDLLIFGCATFALWLAVHGWPLIRSEEAWAERYRSSDIGQPEGLAYKIKLFEADAREHGWVVERPDIPGLPSGVDD